MRVHTSPLAYSPSRSPVVALDRWSARRDPLACVMSALLFVIPGCQNSRERPAESAGTPYAEPRCESQAAPPAEATVVQPTPTVTRTGPPREDREREIREAMAGLRYDSGVATVDTEVAPRIVPNPDPAQVDSELAAAEAAVARNAHAEAIRALTRAVIHDPDRADSLAHLSAALARAARPVEACAACRSALARDESQEPVRERLAICAQLARRIPEAAEAWREVLDRNPDHPTARGRLAVLLYYTEDYAGAWEMLLAAEERSEIVPSSLRSLLEAVSDTPSP